jgi:hypothetical protein
MIDAMRPGRTKLGPWSSCTISWRPARSCGGLIIVDTFSRFSPALEPRFSFRDADVVEVLERVGREIGLLASTRVDQGTEFVSRDLWPYQRGFETRKADRQCVYRSFQQSFPN